jgi:hypothetical protein
MRNPKVPAPFNLRKKVSAMVSGGPALAAARLREWCVFSEGCPVLNVHLWSGFAPQDGQQTDRLCRWDLDFNVRQLFATGPVWWANAAPSHVD